MLEPVLMTSKPSGVTTFQSGKPTECQSSSVEGLGSVFAAGIFCHNKPRTLAPIFFHLCQEGALDCDNVSACLTCRIPPQ